ncbi:T7SS effector LXG polymorphic toxin [Lentibacillus sp. Marseille-P4043]|uniref:T7SS effector LXG polymorphic toxin n=1 Tax=Lentibacillus sp. Marseille-P4043 TaxID=2040293 RepID=UPI00131A5ECF|nr:T7SS effector LXG polymorphic toxin [Lentibacillus sp. Marseille-P4043]
MQWRLFREKTAKQARGYFGDLHKTILDAFNGLFTDLNDNLKQHLDLFESDVDSSKTAIIESDYLTDTEMDVDEKYEELNFEHQVINRTISSVADITSATTPNFSPVTNDENEVIEEITDLEDKFTSFTSEGKEHDSEIKELLHHIEVAMNRAGRSIGEARFADYKSKSTEVGLGALKDYNEGKREEEIQKARKAKNDAIKDLNEPSQTVVNNALEDLEDGKITSEEFHVILSTFKRINNDKLSEDELNEELPPIVDKYLHDNSVKIGADLGIPIFASVMEQTGLGAMRLGGLVNTFNGIRGPAGSGYYVIVDPKSAKAAKPFFKAGKGIQVAGKYLGPAFAIAGGYLGYVDDRNKGKTPGEAFTHNVVSTGVGFGTSTVATIAIAAAASNPVGWAAVGVAAAGTAIGIGATAFFNWAYNSNILHLQDGLDWAGEQIDNAANWVGDQLDNVGEALSSGLDAINPFS